MGFSITGYVLEPPRVGASNSPFTMTPSDFVSNSTAYNAAYPTSETNPRTDYMVFVMGEGKLINAKFGWTKNEGLLADGAAVQRFDYDSKHQRFYPLPGGAPTVAGVLGPNSNTQRLSVAVPIGVSPTVPFRLSIGLAGSGVTQNVSLVTSFGSPPPGTTELLTSGGSSAGQLNWNSADLMTYNGQTVRFQQQAPFPFSASDGSLGPIQNNALLLNPLPGDTQYPLIRIGFSFWLTAIEKPNESSFSSNPAQGTVEWSLSTGMLKFNSTDISNNGGTVVYFDGILLGANLSLPTQSLGTVNPSTDTLPQPTAITNVPPSGGDIIFFIPGVIQFQEAVSTPVASFDPVGKQGQVQYDPTTGQLILSQADRTNYQFQPLQVTFGDLPVDHGTSMRFFRTPVDLQGTDASVKDVSAIYSVTNATWQSPIIAMSQVLLPSTPIDNPTYPTVVTVAQGTGSFTGTLSDLDGPNPTSGLGYIIDFTKGQLNYAQRSNNLIMLLPQSTSTAILPNPLVVDSQLSFSLETSPGSGMYTPFTESPPGSGVFVSSSGLGGILNATAGQFAFTQIPGEVLVEGSNGSFSSTTFSDTSQNFVSAGVQPGDNLSVLSGSPEGVYTISAVTTNSLTTDLSGGTASNLEYEVLHNSEVVVDRFFEAVELVDPSSKVERINVLGHISNSPRLSVPVQYVRSFRIRYGKGSSATFSISVHVVATDASFSNPTTLPVGTVEVSSATGDLNFSSVDITAGSTVYWSRLLFPNTDYVITPTFGTITFTERFLTNEEALITYTSTNTPSTLIVEPATFLVRKELTQSHPLPISTLSFNPLGHTVFAVQGVFRGGRPQVIGTQCTVSLANSTVTFLSDSQLTNALPHGAIVQPNERVYVDYLVVEALGGEKTITVQNPPISVAQVNITSSQNNFTITGNWVSSFPVGTLLRIEHDRVYLIGTVSYNSGTNLTTVTLGGNETFTDDYQDPNLYITSGIIRISGTPVLPSYFLTEPSSFAPVSKGMNVVKITSDRTSTYKVGTLLLFTDLVSSFQDFYEITGVQYKSDVNQTLVTLSRNTVSQYDVQVLKYSVRPVVESTTTTISTVYSPILSQPVLLWRRTEGSVGTVMNSPTDYTIDGTGNVTISSPLLPNESISISYTGHFSVQAGLRFQASYSSLVSPSAQNGLLNQVLTANYSTFNPDSFYFRVESMNNFIGQVAQDIQNQVLQTVPSGGPTTSNTSQPQLFEKGRPSLYFDEVHIANEDIIARTTLKLYNDAITYLEAALHAMDGRVVGDADGLFVFDGVVGRTISGFPPTGVLNQIDDLIQVSPFPLPNGTYQQIYLTGPYSRFFKNRRNLFTTSPALTGVNTGDPIAKFTFSGIASLPFSAFKRWPRAQIQNSYPSGTGTFTVDNATGTNDALQRPSFVNGMRVVIVGPDGTVYLADSADVTVSSFSATSIVLSSTVGVAVPAGATIYLAPSDTVYAASYQFGKDVNVDLSTGELLYVTGSGNPVHVGNILQANGVGLNVTNLAPYKFSALTGGTTNDDGDQVVPIVGPTFDGELQPNGSSNLQTELTAEQPSTGTFRTNATVPYVGTGSLDATKTVITDTQASYPSPVPKVNDIARIYTGANGFTSYHRISAVGTNSVTVDSPFSVQDSGFKYTIAVSSTTITGTGTFTGTAMSDSTASFTTDGTLPGYTVVITGAGSDLGHRRQVVSITDSHDIVLDSAFPVNGTFTYRIDNSLSTYNGTDHTGVLSALSAELNTIGTVENNAFNGFLSTVFTNLIPTTPTGTVTLALPVLLSDTSQNFIAAEVAVSDIVLVPNGPNLGVYQVIDVVDAHTLEVSPSFPSPGTGIFYQVNSLFGVSFQSLQSIFALFVSNNTFTSSAATFQSLLTGQVPVNIGGTVDSSCFAVSVLSSDLDARSSLVQTRLNSLNNSGTGPRAVLQTVLANTDRLYDKRYTWIDARIDQQSGFLVTQQRAVATRIAAQADIVNQLTKLLALS